MCYIYGKPDHFVNDFQSNNIVKERQINALLRDDHEIQDEIEKKKKAKDKHTPEPNSNNKYFYIDI